MFLNNVEKKILNKYIDTYVNELKIDRRTAEGMAKANIIKAKETAIREGVYNLPSDYWREIFGMEKDNVNNSLTKYYKKAREDGVKDEDIIYWWETYSIERYLMEITHKLISEAICITQLEQGKSEDEAIEFVRKNYPIYGNPLMESKTGLDADRPLPAELMFKVDELYSADDTSELDREAQKFSSFNAFVRYLAKEDRLVKK